MWGVQAHSAIPSRSAETEPGLTTGIHDPSSSAVRKSNRRFPGSIELEHQWDKSRSVRDYFELLTIPEIPAKKKIERSQPSIV